MKIIVSKDIDALNQRFARWMIDYIAETLRSHERFTISLTGGSTPKSLYGLLATDEFKEKISWQKLHVFWGDERYVPFEDDRNNAKMAFDALLNYVPVPRSQIHIMRTDMDPDDSAREYEELLKKYFPAISIDSPLTPEGNQDHNSQRTFDLTLLGLGDNAHALSLFPGQQEIHETRRWVISYYVKEVNMERITLTTPVVNHSGRTAFLVSGQNKADAVSHVLLNDFAPDLYPAQLIKPLNGELYWFLDEPAAARIRR